MKFLNRFKQYRLKMKVSAICKEYGIKNWTLNDDGSIDVDGDVYLNFSFMKLPLRFRRVSGDFDCSWNNLTNLRGCPTNVGGYFNCSSNELSSLEGCPTNVSGIFTCDNNKLTSLEGCPTNVGGDFNCNDNELNTLLGCPNSVGGDFWCLYNQIRDFEGIGIVDGNLYFDANPIHEIWKLFQDTSKIELLNDYDAIRGDEIILDRLNDFLRVIGIRTVREVRGYKCI